MDENLQRLARELRRETCPQRVLDAVARRLSAQGPAPGRVRFGITLAAAGLAVVFALTLWRWPAEKQARQQAELAERRMDAAQVAEQAEGALGYIGRVLLDAGAHSEKVVLEGAVPHLRNSLETARNKIMDHI
jgi:type II secretory pathway component PulM